MNTTDSLKPPVPPSHQNKKSSDPNFPDPLTQPTVEGDKISQILPNEELTIISPETHPEVFVPVAPDGGWSWMVLIASFCSNFIVDGVCATVGLFMLEWSTHYDASKTTISLVSSLMLGFYQIMGPVAAALINKFGCRSVAALGAVLASISIYLSSIAPTIHMLLITFGIIAGIAFGLIYLPSLISVSFYFNRRRALANGISVTGTPFGSVIFGPLTNYLFEVYGWKNTMFLYSAVLLHCVGCACIYRPLKPVFNLEPIDPSANQADELALEIAEELQNNLITSNSMIRSLLPLKIGQPLYEVDESPDHETKIADSNIENGEQVLSNPIQLQSKSVKESPDNSGPPIHNGSIVARSNSSSSSVLSAPSVLSRRGSLDSQTESLPDRSVADGQGSTKTDFDNRTASTRPATQSQLIKTKVENESQEIGKSTPSNKGLERRPQPTGTSRSRRDPTACIFSTPCLVSDQSENREVLHRWRQNQLIRALRNHARPLQHKSVRLRSPRDLIRSQRQRQISHNLTPTIPTIEEGQILVQPNPQDYFSSNPMADFSSAITVANMMGSDLNRRLLGKYGIGLSATAQSIHSSNLHQSVLSGLTNMAQKIEVARLGSRPILVALPHHSISIEDYSRPLYRNDIFFSGNLIPKPMTESQYMLSKPDTPTSNNPQHRINTELFQSGTNMSLTGLSRRTSQRTDSASTGLNTTDLENPALSNLNPNWVESYLVSLTNIPIPNTVNAANMDGVSCTGALGDSRIGTSHFVSRTTLADKTTAQANQSDKHPNSSCTRSCLNLIRCCCNKYWWSLLFNRKVKSNQNKSGYVTVTASGLRNDLVASQSLEEVKEDRSIYQSPPICCSCSSKAFVDVLCTMLDTSLFRIPQFTILWIANSVLVLGLYVPFIFVSEFAAQYGIPPSKSSYLLSFMGGASICGRLIIAWFSGLSFVSPMWIQIWCQFILGLVVALMPTFTTYSSMVISFVLYGFLTGALSSLSNIILYDLIGMDNLTTAVGLIILSRGLSSVFGSPLTAFLFDLTGDYTLPYVASGVAMILAGWMCVCIVYFHQLAQLWDYVWHRRRLDEKINDLLDKTVSSSNNSSYIQDQNDLDHD